MVSLGSETIVTSNKHAGHCTFTFSWWHWRKRPEYFLGAFSKFRRATVTFVVSVCQSAWNNSAATGRRFMKFDIWGFFENLPRKIKFDENLTRITGTFYEDLCKFMLTSQLIFLGWEMFQTKLVEKIKADILCLVICLRKSYHLWDNVERYGKARQVTGGNTIRRKKEMRFVRRITKARMQTPTHSSWRMKDQLDVTCYFISLLVCSTCFGH